MATPRGEGRIQEDLAKRQTVTREVLLSGLTDLMFDRYAGDNTTQLEVWQKLYFGPDGETISLPSLNLMSFLSAHNTNSAPKRLYDKRKFKDICNACLSYVSITPATLQLLRDGAPIKFGRFDGDVDALSGCYIHRSVARLDKGIPNPKVRPVLPLPWDLAFRLTILPNSEVNEQLVLNLFESGGLAIGLGTFRGVFGKFHVAQWR